VLLGAGYVALAQRRRGGRDPGAVGREIARREGVTRARVTQVMGLLRLAPALQERILCMPKTDRWKAITERVLRPIARLECAKAQVGAFSVLLEATR
jgi:hypothetical protein